MTGSWEPFRADAGPRGRVGLSLRWRDVRLITISTVGMVFLAGCASTGAALRTSTVAPPAASAPSSAPVAPSPTIVQTLTLAAPERARGRLTLTKTAAIYDGSGSITVSDDLGQWIFSYAPVALADPAVKIQALGIRVQRASGEALEIDWNETALVDPLGNRHRVVHRGELTPGSDVAVWANDVGLEMLPQGRSVTLVLALRRGDQRPVKTFVFESRLPEIEAPPGPRPISKWVGERFVVLPRPPSRPRDPYEALEIRDKIGRHPTPEEIAGAILTVTSVRYDRLALIVTFVREGTEQAYVAHPTAGSLEGLAPLPDIEGARKDWRGKTLWLATPDLQTLGDGSEAPRVLPVKRLARVDVVDVQPSWSSHAPIRFTVRTAAGALGFRDVYTTGTNVPEAERPRRAFDRAFLTQDPRTTVDWPEPVWAAIEDSRVVVGMTAAQARMSWGEPRRAERVVSGSGREERWTYADRRTLVLVDGLVTEVAP